MVHTRLRISVFFLSFGWLTVGISVQGCSGSCPEQEAACSDSPPTDELCQAYFQRWFFDASTNQCQQIGYSGCGQYGFASQAECQACQCSE